MSGWKPKKKKTAGTAISRTAEREFTRDLTRLAQLDENAKKIQKNMNKCGDCLNAQSKAEIKLANEFAQSWFCQNDDAMRGFSDEWRDAVTKKERYNHELTANSQKAIVEPMKRLRTIFPSVQAAVQKREKSLQEYEKCLAKVDKYQGRERTGQTIVKMEVARKALAAAKEDFTYHQDSLQEDMPKLYERRIDYIKPSLQALIRSQMKYYTEANKICTEASECMNTKKDRLTDEEYDKHLQDKLAEIKALSITD